MRSSEASERTFSFLTETAEFTENKLSCLNLKMRVVFFHRKPNTCHFSIEGFFETMRSYLPSEIECVIAESRFESRGILKRLYNMLEAVFRQGDVNHITGDIHYVSFFLKKKKTLLSIMDCEILSRTSGIKRQIIKLLWYVIPEKKAALITVISESTKKELQNFISCNPDKIIVVPVCISPLFSYKERLLQKSEKSFSVIVSLSNYDHKSNGYITLRQAQGDNSGLLQEPQEYSFNSTKPTILQIGTTANKNLFRLFEALRDIPCRLSIIGKLTEDHKKALGNYGIEYSNSIGITKEELVREYEQCDFVAFVSTYEGFGMPILEANAVGRPVITGNISSMPEVAGDAACLVDPFTVEEIRAGILRIINDKVYREQLIQSGLKNVQRYRPEVIARQYAELYKELADAM